MRGQRIRDINNTAGFGSSLRVWLLLPLWFVLGAALLILSACVNRTDPAKSTDGFVVAPNGATNPIGVDRLRTGMTQAEVLAILAPLYPVLHSADAEPGRPLIDIFPYNDDGTKKYIEILYSETGLVDWIRFGHSKTYVIE